MEIRCFVCNPFEENTYLIWDETSRQAAIVDPGMIDPREENAIDSFIADNKLIVKYILLTHAHLDHVFGARHAKTTYGVDIIAHKGDQPLAASLPDQAARFHLPYRLSPLTIDSFASDGQTLTLGNEEIKALNVPGHSEGSLAYYMPHDGYLLSGDVLFNNAVGRTDLPGGSTAKLYQSITGKLLTLPDDTIVFPGHGSPTTIKAEKRRF